MDALANAGVGLSTQHAVLKTLGAGLQDAVERDLITQNPVARIKLPRTKSKPVTILSEKQTLILLREARASQYYALFVLALVACMRVSELFALDWENVDLDNRYLDVQWGYSINDQGRFVRKELKTRSSRRRVPLPLIAIDALGELPPPHEGPVFKNSKGGRLDRHNFLRREFRPLLQKAGLPRVTFHNLRHVSNSLLANEGEGLPLLQARGGWSSARMPLEVYGHLMPAVHERAVEKLDAIFSPSRIEAGRTPRS